MSGSSVCVLTPNGRRQTVKCTPNTTILQIIEEVCLKHGFKPEEYDIRHHNKILDASAIFRFSGLPNNASLELTTAIRTRSETDITLAISLEDGTRLMGNFHPSTTLSNVLTQLCPENVNHEKNPIVIYTRREIYGSALDSTTLKSLGLTGGRAMLRLIHKSPEELKVQANVSAPLPSKPVEEKPYRRVLKKSESPPPPKEVSVASEPEVSAANEPEASNDQDMVEMPKTKPIQKNNKIDILQLAREKRKAEEISPVKNDQRKLIEQNITSSEARTPVSDDCKCEAMEIDSGCASTCKENCSYKESKEDDFVFLGTRNAMLFSLETAQAIPSEDLPDDFFELTINDAKKILKDVKKRRFEMDNNPMLTANLRNLEDSKRQLRQLNKYKKAIIRVQFPDRTVLQGTFSPSDTVGEIVEFVREYLEDKLLDFYIYATPPKCILNHESRLIEIGCVPGALLYFGTQDKRDSLLRKDLQNKFTTNSVASLVASKMRHAATRCGTDYMDEDFEDDDTVNVGASTSAGISSTTEEYGERKIIKSTENVPKWFKTSK